MGDSMYYNLIDAGYVVDRVSRTTALNGLGNHGFRGHHNCLTNR